MQDTSRSSTIKSLPRLGDRLARLRSWESDFRQLAGQSGFAELNLPLSLPTTEFSSRLTGESVLPGAPRFLDSNGTEWSLRTDLTVFSAQFVCRHSSELSFPFKLFYSGKVFSPQGLLGAEGFRLGHASEFESLEFGAEIVGEKELEAEDQLLDLAVSALGRFGYNGTTVVVGDARVVAKLESVVLEKIQNPQNRAATKAALRDAVFCKDFAAVNAIFDKIELNAGEFWKTCVEYQRLLDAVARFRISHPTIKFIVDPFLMRQRSFYSGLVFDFLALDAQGFLKNVGGGGRYDKLLEHFGLTQMAVGFMLRDPQTTGVADEGLAPCKAELKPVADRRDDSCARPVRIALPKGRLQKWGVQAFADVGIRLPENPETTRKLVLKSECGRYEFLFVKNSDVVSYVERGIAEIALAGSDLLDEADASSVLRPVTFAFGKCRICLAGSPDAQERLFGKARPRVATKYPHMALRLLRELGLEPELIPLQGSVELASVISFCDAIVDLVETGSTLRENGLIVFRELASTRVQLITSRGHFAQAHETLKHWLHHWSSHGHVELGHFEIDHLGENKNDSGSKNATTNL
ncbi:MAG: ATP phosphoribosyltransferase [Silvanigrellaceae bacterium]